MNKNKFSIILSEEAQSFLESLPYDAKEKIAYNIRRVMDGEINKELFKSWKILMVYGSSALFTAKLHTDFLPFGTQRKKLLLLPLTASSRRHRKLRLRK